MSSIAFHRGKTHENRTILLKVMISDVTWGRVLDFEIRQLFLVLKQKITIIVWQLFSSLHYAVKFIYHLLQNITRNHIKDLRSLFTIYSLKSKRVWSLYAYDESFVFRDSTPRSLDLSSQTFQVIDLNSLQNLIQYCLNDICCIGHTSDILEALC